jgi:RimJ/RimL family protein N-acetyltransferase
LKQFLGQEVRRPLFAHVAKHNIGSRRVLEKNGFIIFGEDKVLFENKEIEEFILKLNE